MGLLLTHVLKYHRELAELVVGGGEQTGQECGVRTHRSVVCAHAGVWCVHRQKGEKMKKFFLQSRTTPGSEQESLKLLCGSYLNTAGKQ